MIHYGGELFYFVVENRKQTTQFPTIQTVRDLLITDIYGKNRKTGQQG